MYLLVAGDAKTTRQIPAKEKFITTEVEMMNISRVAEPFRKKSVVSEPPSRQGTWKEADKSSETWEIIQKWAEYGASLHFLEGIGEPKKNL